MKFIGAGIRSLTMAVVMGDSPWPAVTILAVSIVLAVAVSALRRRRGR